MDSVEWISPSTQSGQSPSPHIRNFCKENKKDKIIGGRLQMKTIESPSFNQTQTQFSLWAIVHFGTLNKFNCMTELDRMGNSSYHTKYIYNYIPIVREK